MYWRTLFRFLIVTSFVLFSSNLSAETTSPIKSNQGIGALGHIEPRSRVIRVSHNAGPEGARVKHVTSTKTNMEVVVHGARLAISKHCASHIVV